MKLVNDLYTIIESKHELDSIEHFIEFNPSHKIYLGHYPGYPITPGVIQMAIIEELCEQQLNRKLRILNITTCKFVKLINPIMNPTIKVVISLKKSDANILVSASFSNEDSVFFKLKSAYEMI